MKSSVLLPLLTLGLQAAWAQDNGQDSAKAPTAQSSAPNEEVENLRQKVEGLNDSYLETKATVDKHDQVKVSGYIQPQWQWTDSVSHARSTDSTGTGGAAGFAGGNFNPGVQNRFMIRRAYLKTAYKTGLSQYVLQFELKENTNANAINLTLKDAFAAITDPWTKAFTLTAGQFDVPFGFEVPFSSSLRESPERSRVVQVLFPSEKDIGVQLEYADEKGPLSFLNVKGGVFNGNANKADFDNEKSAIGRLGFKFPFNDLNLAVDGGVSGYYAKAMNLADTAWTMSGKSFTPDLGAYDAKYDRMYYGADLQVYYDLPVVGGFSLRGEMIGGKQPGYLNNSSYYGSQNALPFKVPLAERNFLGWYAMYVQNLGPWAQFVLKYDVYDPNTDVEGSDIGVAANAKLGAADIAFKTLGVGANFFLDGNTKLMAYYEMPQNDKTASGAYSKDIKDDVFTLRLQYKF